MIDSNVHFNIYERKKKLNCGSKPDEIGFQNAETKPHVSHTVK